MRLSTRRAVLFLLGCAGILALILWLREAAAPVSPEAPKTSPLRDPSANETSKLSGADAPEARLSIGVAPSSTPRAASAARTTGSFTGTIREENGSLIEGAATWIALTDGAGRRRLSTGESDRFVFGELPFGSYAVTVYAQERRMAAERIELDASQPDVEREFRLPRLPRIGVSVLTPDGRPFRIARRDAGAPNILNEIMPVATREAPGTRFDAMRGSGPDPVGIGEFWDDSSTLSDPDASPERMGTLVLHAEPPAYVSLILGQTVLQTKRVELGTREVTFLLSVDEAIAVLPSVRAQVVDAITSAPVEGADLVLHCGRGTIEGGSDPAGEALLQPVLPGRFSFVCSKEGYASSRGELDAEPGRVTDLTLRLSPPLDVELHVFAPDGKPCASSLSVAWLQGPTRRRPQRVELVHSNAHGNVVVRGLDRGTYLLSSPSGGIGDPNGIGEDRIEFVPANILIDTTSGPPPPIEVRLAKAVTLWIRSPPGDPVDLEFEVTDARDLPVCGERFDLPWPRRLRLAPGKYRVRFKDSSGKVLEEKEVALVSSPVELAFGG